jgi:hypothetical protein
VSEAAGEGREAKNYGRRPEERDDGLLGRFRRRQEIPLAVRDRQGGSHSPLKARGGDGGAVGSGVLGDRCPRQRRRARDRRGPGGWAGHSPPDTILLERGERVRHIPGTAVNKVRDAYPGGEHKSDPKDAFVIADQLRFGWRSLR